MDMPCDQEVASRCREMSNYMVFVNPEMLIAGARRKLFKSAYKELKKIVLDEILQAACEKEMTRDRVEKIRDKEGSSLVLDAWATARELNRVRTTGLDDDRIWTAIQGAWVEMLCFSASRCRGYLHAKNLGKGGEYLSYVWLLMSYTGMETLADTMQRTELPDEELSTAGPDNDI